ncbi:MAG: phosphotransferase [Polyangiaceae bacterium]
MTLFRPDDLCVATARYEAETDSAVLERVRDVSASAFGRPAIVVDRLVHAHPEAVLHRVGTAGGVHVLKSVRGEAGRRRLEREAAVALLLHRGDAPTPRPIGARSGDVARRDDWTFAAFEYVDGPHYTGSNRGLLRIATAYARLSAAAGPPDTWPWKNASTTSTGPANLVSLWSRVEAQDGTPAGAVARRHAPRIVEATRRAAESAERVAAYPTVVHVDGHPLNVVLGPDERPTLLDFEDVLPAPVALGAGFTFFKLARRLVVARGSLPTPEERRSLTECWLANVREAAAGTHAAAAFTSLDAGSLAEGARARILALLELVLRTSLDDGDDRYMRDFEKHTLALAELDAWFGSIGPAPSPTRQD